MKKALVLLALPLIALTSCDKESLKKYNLTMSENRHVGVEIKALALDFYSDIEATRSFMSITISNRTTKDVTLQFKNTYFTDHDGNKYSFDLSWPGYVTANEVNVKIMSEETVSGEIGHGYEEIMGGLRFHTVINGKWEFSIKNIGVYR